MSSGQRLNPEQKLAVDHNTGPLLILAGAGSGKTTVLVSRTERLLREGIVRPDQLCVLTFTNKAAKELKGRVTRKLKGKAEGLFAGTFHSFGLQILRKHHEKLGLPKFFSVVDSKDSAALMKECVSDLRTGKAGYDIDDLMRLISEWRQKGQTKAQKDEAYEVAAEVLLPKYLRKLQLLGAVDFDGLLLRPLELMESNAHICEQLQSTYQQVMVDEFQDTNGTQMRLLNKLVAPHKNLSVVGDDDQSIYGWRGAKISNILNFPSLYTGCKLVRLETNYRSTPAILALANHIIAQNPQRHPKTLRPGISTTEQALPELSVYDTAEEEAEYVCTQLASQKENGRKYKDFAVLYRSNSQGALMEAELRSREIPYRISGGTGFFDRKETRDALAYLRTALRASDVSLRRIWNTPSRGLGESTLEKIGNHCQSHNISFVKATKGWRTFGIEPSIGAKIDLLWSQILKLKMDLEQAGQFPSTVFMPFLQMIGYKQYLEKHSKDSVVAGRRWQYLQIFAEVMDSFAKRAVNVQEGLADFIEAMELRDNVDHKENEDRVNLLTLHACKGLEFPVVYLLGVEEDILPHKTLGSDVSEERRLFYVGITRAMERLFLSHTRSRQRHGKAMQVAPSRFLNALGPELIIKHDGPPKGDPERRKQMVAALFSRLDALDGKAVTKSP